MEKVGDCQKKGGRKRKVLIGPGEGDELLTFSGKEGGTSTKDDTVKRVYIGRPGAIK